MLTKRFLLFALFCFGIVNLSSAQLVFEEDFSNNKKYWNLPNNQQNQSLLQNGQCLWKHTGPEPGYLMEYINRLDTRNNFSFEVKIVLRQPGSEHGVIWGGVDPNNANYFVLKGKKFKVFKLKNGKVQGVVEYKTNIMVRLDQNILKVEREGSTVTYYVNNKKIYSESYTGVDGKVFGVCQWGNSAILIDDFRIYGEKLPINLIEGLYYNEPPENLGNGVNSRYDEMTPVIAPDGKGLYFSRKYHPKNVGGPSDLQDVYFSELLGTQFQGGINLGSPINNSGPNAVFSVTPDHNTLLLMNTYEADGRPKSQGLSMSRRTSDGWSVPEELKIRKYYNKSTFNEFFLSNDGKVLIFAIERDDTKGRRDLYVSRSEGNGIWSEPRNMGSVINTSGTELSPFLASDGVTLYFSSNGHPGYGKNDIFMTRRLDDSWTRWSKPQNLGEPINGPGINSYYSVPASGEYAYFISSEKSLGLTDVFRVKLPSKVKPNPVVLVRGRVLNSKTKEPIGTEITYRDFETDVEVGVANSDPKTGKYEIVLPLDKVYSFFAEKDGYYSVRDRLDLTDVGDYEEIERDLYLTPIEIGQTAQLHNVLFVRGKPVLINTSYPELNKLAKTLIDNAGIEIELLGHTDNVGDPELNQKLSEDRVEAVRRYLINRGVEPNRIKGIGFGGSKPIADNSKEETRRLNRRVEFKIIKH